MWGSRSSLGDGGVKLWVETRITLEQQPTRFICTAWTLSPDDDTVAIQQKLVQGSYELLKSAKMQSGSRRCSLCEVCTDRCGFAQRQLRRAAPCCKRCTQQGELVKQVEKKARTESQRLLASQVPLPKPRPTLERQAALEMQWERIASRPKMCIRVHWELFGSPQARFLRSLQETVFVCYVHGRIPHKMRSKLGELTGECVWCWHLRRKRYHARRRAGHTFTPPAPRPPPQLGGVWRHVGFRWLNNFTVRQVRHDLYLCAHAVKRYKQAASQYPGERFSLWQYSDAFETWLHEYISRYGL